MFGISIHKNDANVTFENFQFFFYFITIIGLLLKIYTLSHKEKYLKWN